MKVIDRQLIYDGVEEALGLLKDIISGDTFGDLDSTREGVKGRRVGLSQIEMIRAALSALRDLEGEAK